MTQNLRIAGKTITPADSDVTSNYTIPVSSISGFNALYTSSAYVDLTRSGFYSWHSATAGTGIQSFSIKYQNTTASICAKGWKLPTTISSTSDFKTLYINYNSPSALRSSPVDLTLSGEVTYSSHHYQGSDGYYWSSTVYSDERAYAMCLYKSGSSFGVNPTNPLFRSYGLPVRCLAR